MFPIYHFITAIPLAIILYPIYGIKIFVMLIAGVFVDLDHYIFYVLKTKSFSPSVFYTFHKKLNKEKKFELVKNDLYIFHSIEFIFLFGILSIFSDIIFLAWLGILFHRVVDLVYMKVLAKIWTVHSISIVGWFVNYSRAKALSVARKRFLASSTSPTKHLHER